MTRHLGNSWREVYAALDCSTSAHDEEQPAREFDDRRVTGVTESVGDDREHEDVRTFAKVV